MASLSRGLTAAILLGKTLQFISSEKWNLVSNSNVFYSPVQQNVRCQTANVPAESNTIFSHGMVSEWQPLYEWRLEVHNGTAGWRHLSL